MRWVWPLLLSECFCCRMLHNKHGLCHCVMSICLSHLCILLKQINISSNFFSPLGSYTFLIFPYQRLWDDHCWRLKSSASKTISSVFHLHNTSATCELSVYLDGHRLRHECHPTYLGVTLDRTLSYRVHLTKTAGKLKNRNNLLMKLAGSTWGASANTLRSSTLALCYSAAEYCAPVWSRSAHTSQVKLNHASHL